MRTEVLTYQQAFGDVLQRVRLHRQLTPEQLAANSGVALSRILRFENGMTEPVLSEVFLIGRALGARPGSIVDGVELLMNEAASAQQQPGERNSAQSSAPPAAAP